MKCFVCLFFTVLSVSGFAATTLEFKKDCACKVDFEASASNITGYGDISVKGEGGKLLGKLSEDKGKVSGAVTVSLKDFDMGMRQKHFNEDTEVAKFPTATLKVKDLPSTDGDHELKGELTLHGKTKAITGTYTLKTEGVKRKLRAKFEIKLDDFGVKRRNYEVVKVNETATITVDAVASP